MNDERAARRPSGEPQHGVEERVLGTAKAVGPIVVVALAVAAGYVMGHAVAVLVLAAGVLVAVVATFWTSLRALSGETALTGEDAYAMGAPSAEEEQKRAVLRAIKDLEFEHAVGKISDADYDTLLLRYRAEAKRLLRVLDDRATPARQAAEKIATRHLAEQGLEPRPVAAPGEVDQTETAERDDASDRGSALATKGSARPAVLTISCPGCGASVPGAEPGHKATCAYCGAELHVPAVELRSAERASLPKDDDQERAP